MAARRSGRFACRSRSNAPCAAAAGSRSTTTRKSALFSTSLFCSWRCCGSATSSSLNARANLAAQKITSGFGFLDNTAGFGVNQSLIPYNEPTATAGSSWSGCSTPCWSPGSASCSRPSLGFVVGIARLSPNWLVARLAGGYVELIRNLPLLFQILFWYLAVLGTLPGPRQSLSLVRRDMFSNNRGHVSLPGAAWPGRGSPAAVELAAFVVSARGFVDDCARRVSGRGAGRTAPARRSRCSGWRWRCSSDCRSWC